MTFNCVKMRNADEISFTSYVDWGCLKVGPETALTPKERDETELVTGEPINDI